MKTTHPMIGEWKHTDIPAELAAVVAKLPELPRIEQGGRIEWEKTGESAPAGTYTDPKGTGVKEAVATVLAAGNWTRRRLTVALNFRTSSDFDVVRRALGATKPRPKAEPAPEPVKEPVKKAAAPRTDRGRRRAAAKEAAA